MTSHWKLVDEYLKPIRSLFDDPDITDIMINGAEKIFIQKNGQKIRTPLQLKDEQSLETAIHQIAYATDQHCDESSPIVDAVMPSGDRVCGVLNSVSANGHSLSIRVFPKRHWTAQDLMQRGVFTNEMFEFLQWALKSRSNILISGGVGSGKTTLLKILANLIEIEERVISVEDTPEIALSLPNWVALVAPQLAQEQRNPLTMATLIKTTLRQNPDRILVGEIRDALAAQAFLQAINTGHSGCISTLHANNPEDALIRLEHLCAVNGLPLDFVASQVRSNIQLLVQVQHLPKVGRIVTAIGPVSILCFGFVDFIQYRQNLDFRHKRDRTVKTKVYYFR